jgi:hypothetical protein
LNDVVGFADDIRHHGPWRHAAVARRRRSGTPSWVLILLAGLAGLALAKLMATETRGNLSTAQKAVIGGLLVLLGLVVLSLRRRAAYYRW